MSAVSFGLNRTFCTTGQFQRLQTELTGQQQQSTSNITVWYNAQCWQYKNHVRAHVQHLRSDESRSRSLSYRRRADNFRQNCDYILFRSYCTRLYNACLWPNYTDGHACLNFVTNFLRCVSARNWQNWITSNKVLTDIKRVTLFFLRHSVVRSIYRTFVLWLVPVAFAIFCCVIVMC